MSQTFAQLVQVEAIEPHPNADALEIASILGTKVVVRKGAFIDKEPVVYFPPDLLIPNSRAEQLGVAGYLKHAIYPGDTEKSQCRVGACRLRGQPSYGFVISLREANLPPVCGYGIGADVSEHFGAVKYEPPPRAQAGDAAPEFPTFHRYTSIENYYRYPDMIPVGLPVRITEKIHGTNSRVGLIKVDDEWQFMAGSHGVVRKRPDKGTNSIYWGPLEEESMLNMLSCLCDEQNDVVVFGEIYGPGIQDLDYGVSTGSRGYRVFDISINGRYCDWEFVRTACASHGVETVPLLYEGPFSKDLIEQLTHGPTTVGSPKGKFKGREGIVITPLTESLNANGGRMILKSVSADYLDRKGAQDLGE